MAWMNEYEIDDALDMLKQRAPEYAIYAQYLSDWKNTVNNNSDGWAYWRSGTKCADRLSDLVKKSVGVVRRFEEEHPSHAEFRRALSPIKAAATRHNLPQPVLQPVPPQGPRPY